MTSIHKSDLFGRGPVGTPDHKDGREPGSPHTAGRSDESSFSAEAVSAGSPARVTLNPIFKQFPLDRGMNREVRSAAVYLHLARIALKYDHSGMAYQLASVSPADLSLVMREVAGGDFASRTVASTILGYLAANKVSDQELFTLILPSAEVLTKTVPDLATRTPEPVRARAACLRGITNVLPYCADNHRPVERAVEVVHRTMRTLLDRRDTNALNDAFVSRALTVMGGELMPFAVRSHYELLSRLLRVPLQPEGRRTVDAAVFRGIQSLKAIHDGGATETIQRVGGERLASLTRFCQSQGRLVSNVYALNTLKPGGFPR